MVLQGEKRWDVTGSKRGCVKGCVRWWDKKRVC